MRIELIPALAAFCLAATNVTAQEFKLGDLVIEQPYSPATPRMARTGAGYMTIRNTGTAADALTGVQADFARAELHTTAVDAAGVARMSQVGRIEIPPGETVALAPQGIHVMFLGLSAPFVEGEVLDATLRFERAGEIDVKFNVEARDGGDNEAHDGH